MDERQKDLQRAKLIKNMITGCEGLMLTEARNNAMQDIRVLENELIGIYEKYGGEFTSNSMNLTQIMAKIEELIG